MYRKSQDKKQRAFSGIKPSGDLHIGNYLGAIKQWVKLQDEYEVFFGIMDEHAITVPQDPSELRKRTLDIAMLYIAAGLNPRETTFIIQSHVPAHAELAWILGTLTPMGDLQRMTQYKDAIQKGKTAYAGLFNYPVLMAADILLYHPEIVPVGDDQVQHVELARSIAERFNGRYRETFTIPRARLDKEVARIMSLSDPTKKMSKSDDSSLGYILLLDSPHEIRRKIKIAVTDSEKEVRYDEAKKPAVANLMRIYGAFSDMSMSDIEKQYQGKSYAEFKSDLAELLVEKLTPLQERYRELEANNQQVLDILKKGAEHAREVADKTLRDVQQKIGFVLY